MLLLATMLCELPVSGFYSRWLDGKISRLHASACTLQDKGIDALAAILPACAA
jgi:hypothetical protein